MRDDDKLPPNVKMSSTGDEKVGLLHAEVMEFIGQMLEHFSTIEDDKGKTLSHAEIISGIAHSTLQVLFTAAGTTSALNWLNVVKQNELQRLKEEAELEAKVHESKLDPNEPLPDNVHDISHLLH